MRSTADSKKRLLDNHRRTQYHARLTFDASYLFRITIMSGTLYIVSTPIGNLEDISFRAVRILKEATIIAAEDTRRTQKLCSYYQIGTQLTSYHDFNKEEKTNVLLHQLQGGHDVALVCDAGTPLISDPGYYLVKHTVETKIPIVPIPGPSSVLAALCVSGLATDRFIFEGFVPRKPGAREKFFEKLQPEIGTIIVFETQHRILKTLRAIYKTMGNRQIVLTRELTKLNEEIMRGDVEDLCQILEGKMIKGEITLVIQGQPQRRTKQPAFPAPSSTTHPPSE